MRDVIEAIDSRFASIDGRAEPSWVGYLTKREFKSISDRRLSCVDAYLLGGNVSSFQSSIRIGVRVLQRRQHREALGTNCDW